MAATAVFIFKKVNNETPLFKTTIIVIVMIKMLLFKTNYWNPFIKKKDYNSVADPQASRTESPKCLIKGKSQKLVVSDFSKSRGRSAEELLPKILNILI